MEELGDLVELPKNAILATYRRDGSVLLSPVWHEWRDGGFSIVTGSNDVKLRHIERANRAAAVVADDDYPYRGIEVSCSPTIVRDQDFCAQTQRRIVMRYLGPERGATYLEEVSDEDIVVLRLQPGTLRTWDFADDREAFGVEST